MEVALITGITGQDGSYLASLVKDIMQSDLKLMQKQQYLKDGGYQTNNYFE